MRYDELIKLNKQYHTKIMKLEKIIKDQKEYNKPPKVDLTKIRFNPPELIERVEFINNT